MCVMIGTASMVKHERIVETREVREDNAGKYKHGLNIDHLGLVKYFCLFCTIDWLNSNIQ
jgi:hypothetical protein